MSINDFLKSKKNLDEEPKITIKEHKKVVNELLSNAVQMNIIVAEWCKEIIDTADKSKNPEVIRFAKNSLLSLKKKMAENLFKMTGNNDRVQ